MSTEEQICNIALRLSDLWHDYQTLLVDSQDELRDYVTNKSFPLEDRFEVWTEWCEKEHHEWVINEADVPLFGAVVTENVEDGLCGTDPIRYNEYDWNYFLELFEDGQEYRERFKVTVDDVKEILIKTNFKGYTHDW